MAGTTLLMHILNGLAYGMLLFMIAAGLSIIFGLMHIVNLAHGAFYLAGVYIAYTFVKQNMGFWPSLLISIIIVAILGILMEKFLLERVYGKELEQVLLTFGLAFIFADLVKWIWGTSPLTLPVPAALDASMNLGVITFPAYRIFVIFVGCLLAVLLWYMENKTRIGAIIRAGVDDREMLSALGIHIKIVFTSIFAVGGRAGWFKWCIGRADHGDVCGHRFGNLDFIPRHCRGWRSRNMERGLYRGDFNRRRRYVGTCLVPFVYDGHGFCHYDHCFIAEA